MKNTIEREEIIVSKKIDTLKIKEIIMPNSINNCKDRKVSWGIVKTDHIVDRISSVIYDITQ